MLIGLIARGLVPGAVDGVGGSDFAQMDSVIGHVMPGAALNRAKDAFKTSFHPAQRQVWTIQFSGDGNVVNVAQAKTY